jgi:hypothetical protein
MPGLEYPPPTPSLTDDGLHGLLVGFFLRVCADIARGHAPTLSWLDGPDFDWWAEHAFPSVPPKQVRALLCDLAQTGRWRYVARSGPNRACAQPAA